jgi:hypothetical protein
MVVEFKTVEAIDSLVALLRVADGSAVHCWEQDEPFHPGIFPGLILLARFASQQAGKEYMKAVAAAELNRNLEAERDAARQLHLVECRKYNAEVERRLAMEKQLAELTKKLGELPPEPAPEPYQWQAGDVVESDGESPRLVITRDAKGWVFFKESVFGLPQFEWERLGWGLHRKAADPLPSPQLPAEPEPEPYQWQVGDVVLQNGDVPRQIEDARDGYVMLTGIPVFVLQQHLESYRWKLHRKASDLPPSPQQVAEFAGVTEPIDDSTHAPRFSGLNWVRYQPEEHQLREGRQYMAAFRDFDERGNSLPFEFVVVAPHYDENGILSLDVGDAEVEPTEVMFMALLDDSTGTDGEGHS